MAIADSIQGMIIDRADVHARGALQSLDYAGDLRDVRRRVYLANGDAVDVGADHCREVVGEQAGIERVNPRYDQRARLSHPRQERCRNCAGVLLLVGGHGVFHVGYEGVRAKSGGPLQHIGAIAWNEQQASEDRHVGYSLSECWVKVALAAW